MQRWRPVVQVRVRVRCVVVPTHCLLIGPGGERRFSIYSIASEGQIAETLLKVLHPSPSFIRVQISDNSLEAYRLERLLPAAPWLLHNTMLLGAIGHNLLKWEPLAFCSPALSSYPISG